MVDGDRVLDPDRARIVRGDTEPRVVVRPEQPVRDDLGQTSAAEQVAHRIGHPAWIGPVVRHRRAGHQRGHRVVATNAADLFGHVRFDGDVTPVRRHDRNKRVCRAALLVALGDHEAVVVASRLDGDLDPFQRRTSLVGADLLAQETADAGRAECHSPRRVVIWIGVDHADRDPCAGPLREQLRGSVRAEPRQPRFLALLEPGAGLAAQTRGAAPFA